MRKVEVDLADDRFDVAFDHDMVSVAGLLRTIRDLDYAPEVVRAPSGHAVVSDQIDLASLPEDMQALFFEAKARRKYLLVEFSGPG